MWKTQEPPPLFLMTHHGPLRDPLRQFPPALAMQPVKEPPRSLSPPPPPTAGSDDPIFVFVYHLVAVFVFVYHLVAVFVG